MTTPVKFVTFSKYTIRADHLSAVSEVVESGAIPGMEYQVHVIVAGHTLTEYFGSLREAEAEVERIEKAIGVYAA